LLKLKNLKPTAEPSDLEKEIARLFAVLSTIEDVHGDQYDQVSNQIKKLYPLKEIDSKSGVSSDVLVGAASNLVGILMILHYEHVHVITSKAFNMVGKRLIS
jgi:hypothetical protein